MKKPSKYYILNLGCPKNEVDGQSLEYYLVKHGLTSAEPDNADILIINTCGFIEAAKRESIDEIFRLASLKGDDKILAVTGCLSQRYRDELTKDIPEIDYIFGIYAPEKTAMALVTGDNKKADYSFKYENYYEPLEGRILSPGSHYAYLKISDGCENHCSYCAIPQIRGNYRSRPMAEILKEADYLLSNDVKEVILVAQDTTQYGTGSQDEAKLKDLLNELSVDSRLKWLRLLYAHPARVSKPLLDTISKKDNICSYLDIPLQHVTDNMLKRMNRKVTSRHIKSLLNFIRQDYPEIALRTTFLLGHPGETESDFEELVQFIEEYRFEHIGCFTYSEEEDTVSAKMNNKVDDETANKRYDILMSTQSTIVEERNNELVGKRFEAIVDEYDETDDIYYCRLENQSPEIDSSVLLKSAGKKLNSGEFISIKIRDYNIFDLEGILSDNSV
ncbi:MAG: 30S ribosomal protein S12 methylthiotransferase RimO [candidate division Zixibacteria bacterium]|nr:30S ribosomal protein S12 methylthiotransferase RimO [candidate division Zixibacteria bacterium]